MTTVVPLATAHVTLRGQFFAIAVDTDADVIAAIECLCDMSRDAGRLAETSAEAEAWCHASLILSNELGRKLRGAGLVFPANLMRECQARAAAALPTVAVSRRARARRFFWWLAIAAAWSAWVVFISAIGRRTTP